MEFIAEIGWNFMGDETLALNMIKAAKSAGATTAKFQYWNPDKLKRGPWFDDGRIEIYKRAALNAEKIKYLVSQCAYHEIDFLISAFNAEDAEFLRDLSIRKIKIPSHEVANLDLHNYAATNFEKCYVSLGAGTWEELKGAIQIYQDMNSDWVGMHCVSSYPCPLEMANLKKISTLKQLIDVVGLSDHTEGVLSPSIAYTLGARVFEKHFTSDKSLPGRDNKFAMNRDEFQQMVNNVLSAEKLLSFEGLDALKIESDTISNYRGRWG